MWERLRWVKADGENALVIASSGNPGIGLVLWIIRMFCPREQDEDLSGLFRSALRETDQLANQCRRIGWGCYIAESGIAFFWAFSLAQAVYGWRDDIRFHRPLIVISEAGKGIPILAAILTLGLLQLDAVQESYSLFSFVMNFFCQSSAPVCDRNTDIHISSRRSTYPRRSGWLGN